MISADIDDWAGRAGAVSLLDLIRCVVMSVSLSSLAKCGVELVEERARQKVDQRA